MPCYHPIDAYGKKRSDGKLSFKFAESYARVPYHEKFSYEHYLLPCGQCIGCRLEYSRQWMLRCTLEAQKYPDSSYFVTLTYDDDHLPLRFTPFLVDKLTGEVYDEFVTNPLEPKDLQNFLKRLRRHFDYKYHHTGIRFYACGEYGSNGGRPHYHIIFFNLPLVDLKFRSTLPSGYNEFTSKVIEDTWKSGRISVSPFSPECAGYVARYMMKKLKGLASDAYEKAGLTPEFSRCSTHPGIASEFFDNNKDRIYKYDSIFINGQKFKPPHYFDRLMSMSDSELISELKDKRRQIVLSSIDPDTDLDEYEYRAVREKNKSYSIRQLPRSL